MKQSTRDKMKATILQHPDFNYSNSPNGTEEDRRFIFNHEVFTDIVEAYVYAMENKP